ncbi:terminase, partial [bacterium]|nr:terminase [bacterium]
TSRQGIRGKSVNLLYVDETAIIPNNIAEEFFTAVSPTISAGSTTKILLSSTPLGYNHFWKFWNDAENDRNDFIPLFIPYWKIPGRDEKWAEEQRRQLGELKFNQEILCAFLGSSLTLIAADSIAQMSASKPIYSKDGLDIYEKVEKNGAYALIADVAKGVGGDYSAFTVIRIDEMPYRQVGKFRDNQISPLLYPSIIYKVAKEYNEAWTLIEINTSEQVAEILHSEYEYENIIFINRTNQGQVVSGGFGGGKTQLGVNTDKKIKRIGCMNFKSLIEGKKLLIQDADTIAEISTFIEKRHSYAADEGYHDDLVMPLVLFSWLTTNPYFKELTNTNIRKELYEQRMKMIEDEIAPFGIIDNGLSDNKIVDGAGQVWEIDKDSEKHISDNLFMKM